LLKLTIDIGEISASKHWLRRHVSSSQAWRTFPDNHAKTMVSVDFLVARICS
jgi:hypothetical protein